MKILHDEKLLQRSIEELDLNSKFDITAVSPMLCRFEKGELLSGPHIRQKYLLFVVSGIAQIYGIGLDGRKIPVNLAKRGNVIGDVEFCNSRNSNLFSEVSKELTCIGISIREYRDVLENDVRFLRFLLSGISAKVYLHSVAEAPPISVEEKLLHYMQEECEDHVLNGIEHATLHLRCSRRQLQRVLKDLCEQGEIVREGKGIYRLAETESS